MINGAVIGIVLDNKDPDGLHRVLVKFPVDAEGELKSSWVRMASPMAGDTRGLVMLPDVGTEVVMLYAYRSMTPYILGGVYNGEEDKPEPYRNDDEKNDKRVFWSRNDHLVIFDDTEGEEKVEFGAQAATRLQIESAPIYQRLDPVEKTITEYSDKNRIWEAKESISIKCKDLVLEAENAVEIEAGQSAIFKAGSSTEISSGGEQVYEAGEVQVNPSGSVPDPSAPLDLPEHKHPPSKAE